MELWPLFYDACAALEQGISIIVHGTCILWEEDSLLEQRHLADLAYVSLKAPTICRNG